MRVYRDISETKYDINTALTLGTFDGVHLGHRQLFSLLKQQAAKDNLRTFVITFDPHPRAVLLPHNQLPVLTTTDEKLRLFEQAGIDAVLVIKFTQEFANVSSEDFLKDYLLKSIGLRSLVVGYDFRFGRGRRGDAAMLKDFAQSEGFSFTSVPEFKKDDVTVSSSLIRGFLTQGRADLANEYLGYRFSFCGKVVEGNKRGRTLGFPTANIDVSDKQKLIPGNGVYAVKVEGKNISRGGVMNIGVRPTFNEEPVVLAEVHLIDFDADIYGEQLCIYPFVKIRDEKKFTSVDELKLQIESDRQTATQMLKNLSF
ncbi:MAG: riboflavin biosynthesis protein [Ignavibacteriales bacterium]|jgi:riboflavin kinase/FMN adenylyltransferase